jgi:hypothetical protein
MTNDLGHWINCRTTQSMEQGLTGRFANNEVVALGNYTVHSKHKRVSGTGQASSLAGSRCASRVYLADSCRLLQRASRCTDANLQRANARPNFFFLPFLPYCLFFYQPHCPPSLHLHLVTHYLDHLWSSTRLESLALSLHSFNSAF